MEFFPGLVSRHLGRPIFIANGGGLALIESADASIDFDNSVFDFCVTRDSKYAYVYSDNGVFLLESLFEPCFHRFDITGRLPSREIRMVRWISDTELVVLDSSSSLHFFSATEKQITKDVKCADALTCFAGDAKSGLVGASGQELIWLGSGDERAGSDGRVDVGHVITCISVIGDFVYAATTGGVFAARVAALRAGSARVYQVAHARDVTGFVESFMVTLHGAFEVSGLDVWKVFDGEVAGICSDPFLVLDNSGAIHRDRKLREGQFDRFLEDELFDYVRRLQEYKKRLLAKQEALARRADRLVVRWEQIVGLSIQFEKLLERCKPDSSVIAKCFNVKLVQAMGTIAKALNDELRLRFFNLFEVIIKNGEKKNIEIVEEAIVAAAAVIKEADNKKEMIASTVELLKSIFKGEATFLDRPLIESDGELNICPKVYQLISATLASKTQSVAGLPEDLFGPCIKEIEEKIQSKSKTAGVMCRNLTQLLPVGNDLSPEFQRQLALAIARIFVCDKGTLAATNVTDDILSSLESVLLSVLGTHPKFVPELQAISRQSKAPANRLDAILSSAPK